MATPALAKPIKNKKQFKITVVVAAAAAASAAPATITTAQKTNKLTKVAATSPAATEATLPLFQCYLPGPFGRLEPGKNT